MIWLIGIPVLVALICGLGWRLTAQARRRDCEQHASVVASLETAISGRDAAIAALRDERDRLRQVADDRLADVQRLRAELAQCREPGSGARRLAELGRPS